MADDKTRKDIDYLQREAASNAKHALERDHDLEKRVSELEMQVGALREVLEQEALGRENFARSLAGLEVVKPQSNV